jgi:Arc-like DNA binding dprotein
MRERRETEIVQVNLRLREELRRRVRRESDKAGRSFNAELVRLIEQGLEYAEAKRALEEERGRAAKMQEKAFDVMVHALSAVDLTTASPDIDTPELKGNQGKK